MKSFDRLEYEQGSLLVQDTGSKIEIVWDSFYVETLNVHAAQKIRAVLDNYILRQELEQVGVVFPK